MLPYFERAKQMCELFHLEFKMPVASTARQWIAQIENELSGENLTCDGELRGRALEQKRRELQNALDYCRLLLPATQAPRVSGYALAYGLVRAARRNRTQERVQRLNQALHQGFLPGVRVILKNGVRGKIVKINRTRVLVDGEDGRKWSVPPPCMRLEPKEETR